MARIDKLSSSELGQLQRSSKPVTSDHGLFLSLICLVSFILGAN